jgi:uncharacterized protein DUF2852
MDAMSAIAAKLDDIGKPAWIGLMILSFFAFWPLGIAVLMFLIWSGRMSCWKHYAAGPWQQGMGRMSSWCGPRHQSSGNRAFDEYRNETLQRLEEEQREFREFLERLRHAKDKVEFDQFMAERGSRPRDISPEAQE